MSFHAIVLTVPQRFCLSQARVTTVERMKSNISTPLEILLLFTEEFVRTDVTQLTGTEGVMSASISCRTIRIGTHKFDSKEKVSLAALIILQKRIN